MSSHLRIKKAMSRDEVALLVDLVINRPIITSKETNAATNKLKEDAWNTLTADFNAISGQKRTKDQIKLKWDNLKKAARKRMLQSETDVPELVPLGDILEKVSGVLGVTKTDVPYNGDWIVVDSVGESVGNTAKKRKTEKPVEESVFTKYSKKFQPSPDKKEGNGVKERNLAIAKYYEKKTEKLELEIKLLHMEINKKCNCSIDNREMHVSNSVKNVEIVNNCGKNSSSSEFDSTDNISNNTDNSNRFVYVCTKQEVDSP